jgi:hypothetical protein
MGNMNTENIIGVVELERQRKAARIPVRACRILHTKGLFLILIRRKDKWLPVKLRPESRDWNAFGDKTASWLCFRGLCIQRTREVWLVLDLFFSWFVLGNETASWKCARGLCIQRTWRVGLILGLSLCWFVIGDDSGSWKCFGGLCSRRT